MSELTPSVEGWRLQLFNSRRSRDMLVNSH